MTIHLPKDVESSIEAAVQGGFFASADDAVAEAWRTFQLPRKAPSSASAPDSFLGSMRAAADELDEIVVDAYRKRREETWRDISVE